jgi:hypothetical protein
MKEKKKESYIELLSNLKHQCWLRNFIIDPRIVVSDFEIAVIEAFKQMFPGIKARGCFFHFNQCIWKQIKKKDLQNAFETEASIKAWLKKLSSLAFVPQNSMRDAWLMIVNDMYHLPYEHFDKLYGLLLYFNAVWFQKFEISLWNHYDTVGPRTNNHVEGFHSKLNRLCQEAHPNIFKSIGIVKDIETETAINYKH